MKLLEDVRLIRFRDADAGVRNRDFDCSGIARGADGHHSIFGSELDGVGGEVEQHLLQLAGVRQHIAGSQLKVIPKAGHYAPWEQPEAVGAILRRFLDDVSRR